MAVKWSFPARKLSVAVVFVRLVHVKRKVRLAARAVQVRGGAALVLPGGSLAEVGFLRLHLVPALAGPAGSSLLTGGCAHAGPLR